MINLKRLFPVFILLINFWLPQALGASKTHNADLAGDNLLKITFNKTDYILYNLTAGTYDVYSKGKKVFIALTSSVKINGEVRRSSAYPKHVSSFGSINTGFGRGKKYVVTSAKSGWPTMEQVFYTYDKGYFITSVSLSGKDLATNEIVPLEGGFVPPVGEVYSLFMPFDNDTFISYDAKPFKGTKKVTSAEAGVVFNNQNRQGLIAGSLEHEVWKTGVFTTSGQKNSNIRILAGYTEESVTRDRIAHGFVKGSKVSSPLVMVGYFNDWRVGLEEYGKANRIAEPPFVFNWTKPTPVGWNSWGVIQEKLNYEKATAVADFFADSLKAFRDGNTAYIDLDSYWDNMVRNNNGVRDFSKLKEFADYCKQRGLQPGIYWAPFTDWGYKSGADRKMEGSDYKWGDAWTKVGDGYHEIDGARAIDPTFPGTQRRIDYMIDHFKKCGFKMIKIDFLGHAAAESTHFYDTTVTTGMQAYRKGMEYLINRMDGQMLVYAAISPNLASGRYVHTRRIACDAFKSIKDTRYTLNSVTFGWWQTYLYNYVDADHAVFADESEGANRARLLSSVITGTLITGDDYSAQGRWRSIAKKYLQLPELMTIVRNGKAFRPVDGNVEDKASEIFVQHIGKDYYVAVFNYGNDAKSFALDQSRLGIKGSSATVIELFNSAAKLSGASGKTVEVPGADAALFKFHLE